MNNPSDNGSQRRDSILAAAIAVFGKFGFKKSSVDDVAAAAGISKQGLYLHFASKQVLFAAAMKKYLDDGLVMVDAELGKANTPLGDRLLKAMDAWFGRHLTTFAPRSFDVIEAGDRLAGASVDRYKVAFRSKIAAALADSAEFRRSKNVCSPKEIAEVLFLCGLTWKEGQPSRPEFLKRMSLCIRSSCQLKR